MEHLFIIEGKPLEHKDGKWNPIGHSLVDYLPVEWEKIESGLQEHGFNIVGTSAGEYDGLPPEEASRRIIEKFKNFFNGKIRVISLREESFKSLVCEFLTECNINKGYYTETNFIYVMEINGFHIPRFVYKAFDTLSNQEISTMNFMHSNLYNVADTLSDIKDSQILFARQYEYEDTNTFERNIMYYTAIILEIIRQGKFIKQCEHCRRWFVTENKSDEKYCKRESPYQQGKTCAQVMRNIKERDRKKKNPLAKAKEQARMRAYSRETDHPGSIEEFKRLRNEWEVLYKSGQITEQEYVERLHNCMRSGKKGNQRNGTTDRTSKS